MVVIGCGGVKIRQTGSNSYEIEAKISPSGSATDLFHAKAKEACPQGYKIVTKNVLATAQMGSEPVHLVGTIECK